MRFYQLDAARVSWRRFKVLVSQLPAEAAFVQAIRKDDWREGLAKVTGRSYRVTERMSLEDLQRGGV